MDKLAFGLIIIAVLALGAFGAVLAGWGAPAPAASAPSVQPSELVQEVSVRALASGTYDKTEIIVKKGIPVRFSFSADRNAGCGRQLFIPDFNVKLTSMNGETVTATFTPAQAGIYAYRCGMNMFRGRLVVV